jgi:hypothetical protein
LGQCDRPNILSFVCKRQIRQFKNEPIIRPRRKMKMVSKVSMGIILKIIRTNEILNFSK